MSADYRSSNKVGRVPAGMLADIMSRRPSPRHCTRGSEKKRTRRIAPRMGVGRDISTWRIDSTLVRGYIHVSPARKFARRSRVISPRAILNQTRDRTRRDYRAILSVACDRTSKADPLKCELRQRGAAGRTVVDKRRAKCCNCDKGEKLRHE